MAPEPTSETTETSQASITTSDVWDLRADPGRLELLAGTWRSLGSKVSGAEEKITSAAGAVFSKEHWTGDTADAFNDYRKRLADDIERAGAWADNIAQVLDLTATTLRVQQGLLDDERDKLSAVPSSADAETVTFRPADADQTSLVNGSISVAEEIRRRVDTVLEEKRQDLDFYRRQFDLIAEQWKPRSVRLVNLNVGQGAGNSPGDSAGTDSRDMNAIAQAIASQDADIATVQEVFEHDLGSLERELESRTGDSWEVRYTEASTKYQASDNFPILGDRLNASFGNAVLVREGDVIAGAEGSNGVKLDVDGGEIPLPANQPGGGDRSIQDGEGRSAAATDVQIRPR
ncbi:WXG100 family type VII secretion target [Nonomuraea purpurea]|uniref:WXG100 family type VII secretion target n=1 Tax=Nonomuraea purpurea TaxID=1849276 RepID=A0ABV8G1G0_9ACTN